MGAVMMCNDFVLSFEMEDCWSVAAAVGGVAECRLGMKVGVQCAVSAGGWACDERSADAREEIVADAGTHKARVPAPYPPVPYHLKVAMESEKVYKKYFYLVTQIFVRRCCCQSHFLLQIVRFTTEMESN